MGQNHKSRIQAADQGKNVQHTEQPEFNNEGKVDQNAEQCHDIRPLPAKLTDNKTTKLSNQSLESEILQSLKLGNRWITTQNQILVRQPTAFKSERLEISKPQKVESLSETTQTVSALKLPVLKTGDYDLWSMRMEQYLTHTDYAIWEVIVNGDAPAIASASTEGPIPPKTAEQKLDWIKPMIVQKVISQMEIHGEVISQEDANLKLLRSLPSSLAQESGNRNGDAPRRIVPVETPSNALVVQEGIGGYD
ncbi:hypothetical protein Tco_1546137 [Tanacetum coccineum]